MSPAENVGPSAATPGSGRDVHRPSHRSSHRPAPLRALLFAASCFLLSLGHAGTCVLPPTCFWCGTRGIAICSAASPESISDGDVRLPDDWPAAGPVAPM